ncbi:hypothetical protein QUB60_23405 [Microcoleus sp. A2-C5]|uniref:hypothetical protein n=1 Tax=unclassified Microcoleus TaxID=2642155 RepID=UPI002FD46E25
MLINWEEGRRKKEEGRRKKEECEFRLCHCEERSNLSYPGIASFLAMTRFRVRQEICDRLNRQ